jgi:hypothetical protein
MLPAELQTRGYRTAAFAGNDMLALMPFDRMFDHFRLGNTVTVPLAIAGFPRSSSNGADPENGCSARTNRVKCVQRI